MAEEMGLIRAVVRDLKTVTAGRILAFADVEIDIDGIAIGLHGVQVIRAKDNDGREATAVRVPRYRDAGGQWQAAVTLPEALKGPLGDAVLEACCEQGITRRAYG